MDFKVVQRIVASIIQTIESSAVASVNAIKSHVFSVKVRNLPKTQAVKGTVVVANQKNVEKELRASRKVQNTLLKLLRGYSHPKEIKVNNFPDYPEFPEFPTSIKISNLKNFPKNIRVSNQPTKELKEMSSGLTDIEKAIKKLKLSPQINVEAPRIPDINVPEPRVTVTQKDIDYDKLAEAIAEKLPPQSDFDYDKLEKLINANQKDLITVGGGGSGGSNGFRDRSGQPGRALVDTKGRVITSPDYFLADKDTATSIRYTGNESVDGAWYVMRIDGDTVRYASNNNNTSYANYAAAWTDRANLEYGYPSEVDF